jgi:hypothetical protein
MCQTLNIDPPLELIERLQFVLYFRLPGMRDNVSYFKEKTENKI